MYVCRLGIKYKARAFSFSLSRCRVAGAEVKLHTPHSARVRPDLSENQRRPRRTPSSQPLRRQSMAIVGEKGLRKKEGRSADRANEPLLSPSALSFCSIPSARPLFVLPELSSLLSCLPSLHPPCALKSSFSLFLRHKRKAGAPRGRESRVAPTNDRYHQTDKTTTMTAKVVLNRECVRVLSRERNRGTDRLTGAAWPASRLTIERERAL